VYCVPFLLVPFNFTNDKILVKTVGQKYCKTVGSHIKHDDALCIAFVLAFL